MRPVDNPPRAIGLSAPTMWTGPDRVRAPEDKGPAHARSRSNRSMLTAPGILHFQVLKAEYNPGIPAALASALAGMASGGPDSSRSLLSGSLPSQGGSSPSKGNGLSIQIPADGAERYGAAGQTADVGAWSAFAAALGFPEPRPAGMADEPAPLPPLPPPPLAEDAVLRPLPGFGKRPPPRTAAAATPQPVRRPISQYSETEGMGWGYLLSCFVFISRLHATHEMTICVAQIRQHRGSGSGRWQRQRWRQRWRQRLRRQTARQNGRRCQSFGRHRARRRYPTKGRCQSRSSRGSMPNSRLRHPRHWQWRRRARRAKTVPPGARRLHGHQPRLRSSLGALRGQSST